MAVENVHGYEIAHESTSHEGDLWVGEGLSCFPEFLGEASVPEKSVILLLTHSPVEKSGLFLPLDVFARRTSGPGQGQRLATLLKRQAPSHTLVPNLGRRGMKTLLRKNDLFQGGHVDKLW